MPSSSDSARAKPAVDKGLNRRQHLFGVERASRPAR
jgi:hypothetical protein